MAKNMRRVEDVVDAEGWITESGYTAWDCDRCGHEVCRFRGQYDVDCTNCGACYNASGQRLRDDWRGNESTWNDEVGDMEGFEVQQLRSEQHDY
jgi:ribosomal protein S27E